MVSGKWFFVALGDFYIHYALVQTDCSGKLCYVGGDAAFVVSRWRCNGKNTAFLLIKQYLSLISIIYIV